ncbi:MAG: sodium:solute symporter family protein [Raineya sp.]|nr:sodium:solute symporter family protein [Raineya sp.]
MEKSVTILQIFILLYLLITILIGYWASRKVKNAQDFALAGRNLPLGISVACLFATWFGSEVIMGSPSEYAENGFLGIIEEPLGAVLALVLIGLFFTRKLYRLGLLTFGDLFEKRYNSQIAFISSVIMVITYFGWVAAQIKALGEVLESVMNIPIFTGMIIGTLVVLIYTYIGGMWAVSVTDFLQSFIIIVGLIAIWWNLSEQMPLQEVISQSPQKYFQLLPERNFADILAYISAWLTLGLGSIPSQDVLQRILASKSEKVAVQASFLSAWVYLLITAIPLLITLYARILYPELLAENSETLMPVLVKKIGGLGVQILFLGALLSAILSTASGAILAPATVLAENIFLPFIKNKTDKTLLWLLRISVVIITLLSLILANLGESIFELASFAASSGLVTLVVPIWAALYLKQPSCLGALLAMFVGMAVWVILLIFPSETFPANLVGLMASMIGMLLGTWLEHYQNHR